MEYCRTYPNDAPSNVVVPVLGEFSRAIVLFSRRRGFARDRLVVPQRRRMNRTVDRFRVGEFELEDDVDVLVAHTI